MTGASSFRGGWAGRTGRVARVRAGPGDRECWGGGGCDSPTYPGWGGRAGQGGATPPVAAHAAFLWRQLTEDVVVFQHTAEDFDEDTLARFEARGIRVVSGKVTELAIEDRHLAGARLASGEVVARDVMAVAPMFV